MWKKNALYNTLYISVIEQRVHHSSPQSTRDQTIDCQSLAKRTTELPSEETLLHDVNAIADDD